MLRLDGVWRVEGGGEGCTGAAEAAAENFSLRATKCLWWVLLRGLLTADAEMTSGISQEAGELLYSKRCWGPRDGVAEGKGHRACPAGLLTLSRAHRFLGDHIKMQVTAAGVCAPGLDCQALWWWGGTCQPFGRVEVRAQQLELGGK